MTTSAINLRLLEKFNYYFGEVMIYTVRCLLMVASLVLAQPAFSEENTNAAGYLEKGKMTAGGAASLVNSGSSYSNNNSTNLSLSGGYFIIDNLSIDAIVQVSGREKFGASLGLGGTYYFLVQEKWAPFVSLNYLNITPEGGGSSINIYNESVGISYFVLTHVALQLSLRAYQTDSSGDFRKISEGLYGGYAIYF